MAESTATEYYHLFSAGVESWRPHKQIKLEASDGRVLRVYKDQDESTPGLVRKFSLHPERLYNVIVHGSSSEHCFLWVGDEHRQTIHKSNEMIWAGSDTEARLSFTTPTTGQVWIGVLFAYYTPLGASFDLKSVSLELDEPVQSATEDKAPHTLQVSLPDPARTKGASSPDKRVYDLGAPTQVTFHGQDKVRKVVGGVDLPAKSILRVQFAISTNDEGADLLVEGVDTASKKVVLKRRLDRRAQNTRAIFLTDNPVTIDVNLRLSKPVGGNGSVSGTVTSFSIVKLHDRIEAPAVHFGENTTSVGIATYPLRLNTLGAAIDSLVGQVDNLFIYMNNYRHVPEYLLDHPSRNKIHYILDTASTYRAAAKFFWASKLGYNFVCDDDIIYPSDYVSHLRSKVDFYKKKAIVGVHGVIFDEMVTDAMISRKKVFRFQEPLDQDEFVHLLGTGTAAFHSSTVTEIDFGFILRYPIANDESLAVLARKQHIPMVCVERRDDWMKSNELMNFGIFEEKQLVTPEKSRVTALLAQNNPWPEPAFGRYREALFGLAG